MVIGRVKWAGRLAHPSVTSTTLSPTIPRSFSPPLTTSLLHLHPCISPSFPPVLCSSSFLSFVISLFHNLLWLFHVVILYQNIIAILGWFSPPLLTCSTWFDILTAGCQPGVEHLTFTASRTPQQQHLFNLPGNVHRHWDGLNGSDKQERLQS